MIELVAILCLTLLCLTLLRHNRRLTEAALVQTQPHAAAALRTDPLTAAYAARRRKQNPGHEPAGENKPASIQIGM